MPLNRLKTMSPLTVCWKTVFHKTGPWCQKGWEPQFYIFAVLSVVLSPAAQT